MPDASRLYHISSAIITVQPAKAEGVATLVASMPGVEVHAREGSKIVITIEGATTGFLGDSLMQIALLDGVFAANMVFEHVDKLEGTEQ
ncbi:chaperone NapD [Mesorhizobium sp. ANAO-SY3R2]|uniref:chaperone NapD n=1 Tax=Mesorhizobium sp. ANAO-SY3R2 TaxID=3166644 RepID=UPI003671AC48